MAMEISHQLSAKGEKMIKRFGWIVPLLFFVCISSAQSPIPIDSYNLVWDAPTTGGPVESYHVKCTNDGVALPIFITNQTTVLLSDLVQDATGNFSCVISATNTASDGSQQEGPDSVAVPFAVTVPVAVPGPPANPRLEQAQSSNNDGGSIWLSTDFESGSLIGGNPGPGFDSTSGNGALFSLDAGGTMFGAYSATQLYPQNQNEKSGYLNKFSGTSDPNARKYRWRVAMLVDPNWEYVAGTKPWRWFPPAGGQDGSDGPKVESSWAWQGTSGEKVYFSFTNTRVNDASVSVFRSDVGGDVIPLGVIVVWEVDIDFGTPGVSDGYLKVYRGLINATTKAVITPMTLVTQNTAMEWCTADQEIRRRCYFGSFWFGGNLSDSTGAGGQGGPQGPDNNRWFDSITVKQGTSADTLTEIGIPGN